MNMEQAIRIGLIVIVIILVIILFRQYTSSTPIESDTSSPLVDTPVPTDASSITATPPLPSSKNIIPKQTPVETIEEKKRQSSAAVITTCGPCTDNIYNVDCIKDDKTYTCVAGTWVNFGRSPRTIIATPSGPKTVGTIVPQTPDKQVTEISPMFSATTKLTAWIICPEPECKQQPSLKGWMTVQNAISAVSRIDPTFSNNAVEASLNDVTTYGPADSINGIIGLASVRKEKGQLETDSGTMGRGFWVISQTPTREWISFIRSKGIGVWMG